MYQPQVFLEVSIAILQIVFKCPSPAGEGLLQESLEGGEVRDVRARAVEEADAQQRGRDRGRGGESAGGESQRDVDVGEEGVEHGEDAVVLSAGWGGDAARDLGLQH